MIGIEEIKDMVCVVRFDINETIYEQPSILTHKRKIYEIDFKID